jgi:hypothetical protein
MMSDDHSTPLTVMSTNWKVAGADGTGDDWATSTSLSVPRRTLQLLSCQALHERCSCCKAFKERQRTAGWWLSGVKPCSLTKQGLLLVWGHNLLEDFSRGCLGAPEVQQA